ncbi:hypothetical protein B0H19DRAFT_110489 [Mycena capillaripes]|nr:hypothetical protein B0H19DRAFT_110489 [Mycena capillaripes]
MTNCKEMECVSCGARYTPPTPFVLTLRIDVNASMILYIFFDLHESFPLHLVIQARSM